MKKSLSLLLAVIIPAIFFAQSDNTLFGGPNKLKITGVFGGASIIFLEQNIFESSDDLSLQVDRDGFWGVEIANNFDLAFRRISRSTDRVVFGSNEYIDLKTRGVDLAYRPFEDKIIHPMLSVYLASGKLENREIRIKDRILLAQPKAGIEINTLGFMKTSLLVGYNFMDGVELINYSNQDFSRMTLELNLKFGAFWN
jgi:hypothetical protein